MERIDLKQFEGHTPFPWLAMHRDGRDPQTDAVTVIHKIFRLQGLDKPGELAKVVEPTEGERRNPQARQRAGRPVFRARLGEVIVPHYGRYPKGDTRNRKLRRYDEWEANTRLIKRLPEILKALEDAYAEIDRLQAKTEEE